MIRKCDGTDENLRKWILTKDSDNYDGGKYVPCDCGLTFDDVYHLTIYPHEKFPRKG
jgi:hypothetical protein